MDILVDIRKTVMEDSSFGYNDIYNIILKFFNTLLKISRKFFFMIFFYVTKPIQCSQNQFKNRFKNMTLLFLI